MALFKAKTKDIETFETDSDLPAFKIDGNNYIMFEDASLGGAAVFEVIPHVWSEAITHRDPVFPSDSTDLKENPNYEPTNSTVFSDARGTTFPGWVNFLNALQAHDDSDEPTHIQILAKKCRTDEWETRLDYACYTAHKTFDYQAQARQTSRNRHDAMIGAKTADYLRLLDSMQKEVQNIPSHVRDLRKLPSYKVKYFLIVSYTPSSEGWWLDGRDTDYYVRDSSSSSTLFGENQDKMVDRVVEHMFKKHQKKNGSQYIEGGAEDDFFWIETDRTAQVISTRVNKMFMAMERWDRSHPTMQMPFSLEQVPGREAAALICFFPNILTPYWDRIWTLQSDQNEVLYSKDVEKALSTGDMSILDQRELYEGIRYGTVDMRHSQEQQEAFLNRYKNRDYNSLGNITSDHDELMWTPEAEEAERIRQQEAAQYSSASKDLWGALDAGYNLDDSLKTQAQKREEFLNRYKTRGRMRDRDEDN